MSEALAKYLALLVKQMERDAAVMSTDWVYMTVVPFVLYFVYCILKWWILLAPITVPLMAWHRREHGWPKWLKWTKN